jgi:hypothetical protein
MFARNLVVFPAIIESLMHGNYAVAGKRASDVQNSKLAGKAATIFESFGRQF